MILILIIIINCIRINGGSDTCNANAMHVCVWLYTCDDWLIVYIHTRTQHACMQTYIWSHLNHHHLLSLSFSFSLIGNRMKERKRERDDDERMQYGMSRQSYTVLCTFTGQFTEYTLIHPSINQSQAFIHTYMQAYACICIQIFTHPPTHTTYTISIEYNMHIKNEHTIHTYL